MKCPKCNNEVNEQEKKCPNCNAPLNDTNNDNEPTLGRGLVVFIVIGTIFLVAFGFYYYSLHKNDPEYTQTAIEPDSNLADNNKAKFDTIVKDTTAKDSTEKQEEEQAEKVFNSIRRSNRPSRKSSDSESSSSSSERHSSGSETSSGSASETQPIAPAVSKPRVESIELE